ncbi:MAG: Rieske (2Fe-2S) protein [Verrucomicrobia bacterium]|nr:Rieske (2Fe-2S) protein [Verrucomicrobiota bacterium]
MRLPRPGEPRRQFVKRFLLLAAYSRVLTADWNGTLLAEIKPPKRPTFGMMRLRLSDFPALQNDFGSVRIGTSALTANNPLGLLYPILINRATQGQFYALLSECTHAGCAVRPYSKESGACVCPCHGSRYAIDGRRTAGPAFFPLLQYPIQFDGINTLSIELPDLPHEIEGSLVRTLPGAEFRLQLRFLAFAHLEYEVVFRASKTDDWRNVQFSLTPEAPLNRSFVSGADDYLNLYVEPAAGLGFFAVTIRILPV